MKPKQTFKKILMLLTAITAGSWYFSAPALAQEVVVLNRYQEVPASAQQLSKVLAGDVMRHLKDVAGLRQMTFYYDPATGVRGSVLVWQSEGAWQAYLNSDLRKTLVARVKPFLKGSVESTRFQVLMP